MASISSLGYTAPVGFDGDTKIRAFVRSVRDAFSWSTVTRNPVSSVVGKTVVVAPARAIGSGYVVQYGAGSRTSSPAFRMTCMQLYTACFPPLVTTT